jgi:3-dehydroquinate synthetase
MVDASIGGKNGVDVGSYKNMVGTIRQPNFILHDYSFLSSLPEREWSNGFAEIIKHAAIGDADMFQDLTLNDLTKYRSNENKLRRLVTRNVRFKFHVVEKDPLEKGERKKLNFGHTLGHALEMHYELSHGEAISLGMMFAAALSEQRNAFTSRDLLGNTLAQYGLPVAAKFSGKKVFETLSMDKKRKATVIDFITLKQIGAARIQPIPLKNLKVLLDKYK